MKEMKEKTEKTFLWNLSFQENENLKFNKKSL